MFSKHAPNRPVATVDFAAVDGRLSSAQREALLALDRTYSVECYWAPNDDGSVTLELCVVGDQLRAYRNGHVFTATGERIR